MSVPLIIMDGRYRPVNRDLMEIRSPQPGKLRVGIRKETSLQEGIVGKINSRHQIGWMESDLLRFCKEVIRVTIEGQFADPLHRHYLFGNDLGRVQQTVFKFEFVFLIDDLD